MVSCAHLFSKFGAGVHYGVDRAVEAGLGLLESGGEIGEACVTHGDQVDVACRTFLASRDGSVDKGHVDAVLKRFEDAAKKVDQANGLDDEAVELRQEGAVPVGLVVDAVSILTATEHPALDQIRERALKARRASPEVLGQVAQIPPPLRGHQGGGKHILDDFREQSIDGHRFTHNT